MFINVQCGWTNAQIAQIQCSTHTLKRNGANFNAENIEIAQINA